VKEQLRINREEEKQKLLEEKNINDDHRKMLKIAEGLTTKVDYVGHSIVWLNGSVVSALGIRTR